MAKQTINTGAAANDKTGDTLRAAFTKTNANFTEVYTNVTNLTNTVNSLDLTQSSHLVLTNHALDETFFDNDPWVTFVHTDNGTEVDVIDEGLSITRGVQRGIYNPQAEQQYNNNTNESPVGTLWNRDGWYNLENVDERSFDTWRNTVNANPPYSVGKELVMKDTINNKYYAVKFLSWAVGDNGGHGGFAYQRRRINLAVQFVHSNDGSEVDVIDTGLSITRGVQRGIYNPQAEQQFNMSTRASPAGTLWNAEGWTDLSNLTTRTYIPWNQAVDGYPPGSIGKELIMKDTINNKYYAIRFKSWAIGDNGGRGGFSYHRWLINKDETAEGIKFADGSVITSSNELKDIPPTHSGVITGGGADFRLDLSDRGKFIHFRGADGTKDVIVPAHYDNPLPIGYTVSLILDEFNNNRVFIYGQQNDPIIIANGQSIYNTNDWYIGGSGNAGIYTLMKIETNRWILSGPEITFNG